MKTVMDEARTEYFAGKVNNKFQQFADDYGFKVQPCISGHPHTKALASLGFLEKNENIVFLGPSGVGKTHLATSIGIAAAKKRVSTYFIKCNNLLQQLKRAKLENRLEARLKHFAKYKLLIIDELWESSHNSSINNSDIQVIMCTNNYDFLLDKIKANSFFTNTHYIVPTKRIKQYPISLIGLMGGGEKK